MNRLALMILKNTGRLPRLLHKLNFYAKHTEQYPEEEKYAFLQSLFGYAVNAGNVTLESYGVENIPAQGGFLMYGNHQGMFDIMAVAVTCPVPMAAVFKKELSNVPLVKQVIACTKSFAMDREDVRQSLTVIQSVTQEVKNGRRYLIFPEGTRSKTANRMGPFHGGSFRCALKSKCPIVPVAFVDCFKVLDQKGSAPLTVQIHYLPPIPYEEYGHLKSGEVAQLVKSRIQEVLDAYA